MIGFYVSSKRFILKRKRLSYTRIVSTTKRGHGFALHFLKGFINSSKSIFDERSKCDLFNLLLNWKFHNKTVYLV